MSTSSENIHGKVLKGFAWEAISKSTVQVLSWVTTILVARWLDPSDYGLVSIAMLFVHMFSMLADMGLSQSLVHKSSSTPQEEDAIFYFALILGVSLYGMLYLAAPAIASFYRMPPLVEILRVLGLSAIVASLNVVPFAKLMQAMNFRYRAKADMLAIFAGTVTALTMAYSGFGVWTLVAGYLVSQIVTSLCYLKHFAHFPSPRFRLSEVREVLHYGLKLLGSTLTQMIYGRAPTFIAGKFISANHIGQYAQALSLAAVPIDKIGVMFNRVGFPTFSRIKGEPARVRAYFFSMHRYLLIVAFPILVGLALVAEDLVTSLLTEKWRLAGTLLQIVCLGNLLKVSGMIPEYGLLLGIGRANLVLRYNIVTLTVVVIAAYFGSQYGIVQMTLALVAAQALVYVLLMYYALDAMQASLADLFKSMSPAVFGSMFMAAMVLWAQSSLPGNDALPRLLVSIAAGAASYIAFFMVCFRGQIREIKDGIASLRRKDVDIAAAEGAGSVGG